MAGRRRALIVASDEYENPGLSRLRAPAADAEALAKVLGDKDIGDFHVQVVHNEPAHVVGGRIEDLFADSQSDDLLLLHFSGHGLKNDSGELFFAARNTRPDRLASTAVPADFVQRCMRTSRARSIVLFLDCCYGGAFGEGVALRAAGSANVLESFPAGRLGGGRGRAVITASSAMEYAFEGNTLADDHQQQPSVFTSALVEGLTSGEADRDEDGLVSLNELYDFVYDRVRERNPKQTPGRDVELEGDLYLARSQRRRLRPIPIPPDVDAALKSDNMFTRLGAVAELRARLGSSDLGAALGAFQALTEVSRSDIRYVQDAAAEALGTAALTLDPPELHFGTVSSTDLPVTRTIRLTGPPLAIAVSVAQAGAWVTAKVEGAEVRVSADTTMTGPLTGTVTVTGPTGQVVVPVTAEVAPPASETDDQPTETDDRPMETEPPPLVASDRAAATVDEDMAARAVEVPVRSAPEPAAEDSSPPVTPPSTSRHWKWSGVAALVSGCLMLLSIVLPQYWGAPTFEADPIKATYQFYLGLIIVGMGVLALRAQWRNQGLGALVGAWAVGTVVLFDMVNTFQGIGSSGAGGAFLPGFAAPLVLLAAGGFAVTEIRRGSGLKFAAFSLSDRARLLVLAAAVLGALVLLRLALDQYSDDQPGWGLLGLWLAILALWVPVAAVLARPVVLGRWMLIGWSLGCAAPVLGMWLYWEGYDGDSRGLWFVMLTLAAMIALSTKVHDHRRESTVGS